MLLAIAGDKDHAKFQHLVIKWPDGHITDAKRKLLERMSTWGQ
jgi:hypothetical protein